MPMGPVTLADQVGLDICLDVAESMAGSLKSEVAEIPALLRETVEAGHLGRKTGRGFYDWSDGMPRPATSASIGDDPTDRLILPLLNACASCVREGVVGSLDEADAAITFATGFAPFRGGPLHYARSRGHDAIHARLDNFAATCGPRFEPDACWRNGKQR